MVSNRIRISVLATSAIADSRLALVLTISGMKLDGKDKSSAPYYLVAYAHRLDRSNTRRMARNPPRCPAQSSCPYAGQSALGKCVWRAEGLED